MSPQVTNSAVNGDIVTAAVLTPVPDVVVLIKSCSSSKI